MLLCMCCQHNVRKALPDMDEPQCFQNSSSARSLDDIAILKEALFSPNHRMHSLKSQTVDVKPSGGRYL